MIAELGAAALGGFLAAATGWLLDRQREATKLERTRSLLTRAILDDLTYSQQIYDKVAEEWAKTKIVWFSTLNELNQSRQPYMNSKDGVVILDDESLRRDIFRYYLQSTDKIAILENSQSRKYALERTYNDLLRQIQANDPAIDLIEQRRHLGRIVGVLIRQCLRHDPAGRGIDRQMQFAPFPARLCAVFRLQPLTRPVDLQPGAVDQYVQPTVRHRRRLDRRRRHRPTANLV